MSRRSLRISSPAAALPLAVLVALGCSSDPPPSGGVGGTAGTGDPSGGRGGGGRGGGGGGTSGGSGGAVGGAGAGGSGGAAGSGPTAGTGGSGGGNGGSGGSSGSGPSADGSVPGMDAAVPGDTGAPADMSLPVCNHPTWNRTTDYKMGDIVMHMGKAYIALNPSRSLDPTISTYYWAPYKGCTPPAPPPSAKCPALDRLLPGGEEMFRAMFTPPWQGWVPLGAYSYSSLCTAMATPRLAGFAASADLTADRRELAAFFANVAVETAYLTAIDERGHNASDRTFHGRGSLQITGQSNYAEAGRVLGIDLAGQPQLGSTEGVVWQTGIWYWMLHANPSVPAPNICHAAIAQSDFGKTLRIIKGDCASLPDRVAQYRKNTTMLGIEPGKTTCP